MRRTRQELQVKLFGDEVGEGHRSLVEAIRLRHRCCRVCLLPAVRGATRHVGELAQPASPADVTSHASAAAASLPAATPSPPATQPPVAAAAPACRWSGIPGAPTPTHI